MVDDGRGGTVNYSYYMVKSGPDSIIHVCTHVLRYHSSFSWLGVAYMKSELVIIVRHWNSL